ncbi:MAG: KEOPS complex subunit Pcc1 [Candidatus Ranarchaeia archaeon]
MSLVNEINCQIQVNLAPHEAEIFVRSLTPELLADYGQRATTKLEKIDKHNLRIGISSPDIIAMRATLNSLLRWIEMIKQLLEIGGN